MNSNTLRNFFLLILFVISICLGNFNSKVSIYKLAVKNKIYLDNEHKLNDELNTFLNFNINPTELCDSGEKNFIFIYSFTRLNDFLIRQAIRKTWCNLNLFPNIKLVFILGKTNDTDINSQIKNESDLNGDLIQGNFTDTYRNLPYKLLTAFKWISILFKR